MARQLLRRTPLADDQIRGSLPARIRKRVRRPEWLSPIHPVLQHEEIAFIAGRTTDPERLQHEEKAR